MKLFLVIMILISIINSNLEGSVDLKFDSLADIYESQYGKSGVQYAKQIGDLKREIIKDIEEKPEEIIYLKQRIATCLFMPQKSFSEMNSEEIREHYVNRMKLICFMRIMGELDRDMFLGTVNESFESDKISMVNKIFLLEQIFVCRKNLYFSKSKELKDYDKKVIKLCKELEKHVQQDSKYYSSFYKIIAENMVGDLTSKIKITPIDKEYGKEIIQRMVNKTNKFIYKMRYLEILAKSDPKKMEQYLNTLEEYLSDDKVSLVIREICIKKLQEKGREIDQNILEKVKQEKKARDEMVKNVIKNTKK